jgi:hypothetical protein
MVHAMTLREWADRLVVVRQRGPNDVTFATPEAAAARAALTPEERAELEDIEDAIQAGVMAALTRSP